MTNFLTVERLLSSEVEQDSILTYVTFFFMVIHCFMKMMTMQVCIPIFFLLYQFLSHLQYTMYREMKQHCP